MTYTLEDYLLELHIGQWFGFDGEHTYANLVINSDDTKPTEQECIDGVTALQTIYDSKQYQRDRQYAPTGDQLDMLWHSIDAGEFGDTAKQSEFYTANKAVKDANPKP
jgi:hypothetical protein